jgi:uncharacterized protein (TIGR02466 family)
MQIIFPQFYFQYSFSQHNELKKSLSKKYSNKTIFSNVESWNCNSKVSCIEDFSEIQILLEEIFAKFSEEVKQKLQISVQNAWINVYSKGNFQEIHHHLPDSTFSMVYFLDYDKNLDSKFYFYNINSICSTSLGLKSIFNDNLIGDNWYPEVNEGDVIIFPSYLHHGVRPQENNKKRITLSCNFSHSVI